MWIFWLLSLLPITVCAGLVIFNKAVSYKEWLISTGVALLMAGTFQLIASIGMTDDIETWSGYATQSRQYSRWKEYYEEAVYRTEYYTEYETEYYTDGNGDSKSRRVSVQKSRRVFDHWEPHRRWHETTWDVTTTLDTYDVDGNKFNYMCQKFGDRHSVPGKRTTGEHNSKMIDGDPNDYVCDNKTGWIEPVTTTKHFENRVKASPSLFSYSKVPTNISVHIWPKSQDVFSSDRVMGKAKSHISTLKWDQMNAVLGGTKRVNLIIIGFGDEDSSMANWQESAWIGGKKNDLVICYGGGTKTKPATWAKVFGWTEKGIVKQNIQTLLLEYPINDDLIPKISEEVNHNYVIKDWHKFDYLTIEPPVWSYWTYFIVMILVQGSLFVWYHLNDIDQFNDGTLRLNTKLQSFISKVISMFRRNFILAIQIRKIFRQ